MFVRHINLNITQKLNTEQTTNPACTASSNLSLMPWLHVK